MAEINPESPSVISQSQIINLSFGRNRSGNEETEENNRATSSHNVTGDSDYNQSQAINISFGNISVPSDSDNELKNMVTKTLRDISGMHQKQLININFKSVKLENREHQTEETQTETNQNNEDGEQQVSISNGTAIDGNHEIYEVHEVREMQLEQPALETSQMLFENLENSDVEIGNVPNQELNNQKKGKLIGSLRNFVRGLVNLVHNSNFLQIFCFIIKRRKTQDNKTKLLLKND